jgi:ubiquinone/menaquinone biosynthesis C-methylase UbiE
MQGPVENRKIKQEVQSYWNAHPCGTQFSHREIGSKEFFDEVERYRYETQPFMSQLAGFQDFKGMKLLEVGCGLGTDLLQFAKGGAVVTGVDLTARSIELVRRRFAQVGLDVDARVADAEKLPFEDSAFDVVYSFGVLHHTPDTQKAIDEIFRVLKPGGRIVVMLYHKNSLHVWLGAPLYALAARTRNGTASLAEEWVRVYDGAENPLGKAYTKQEVRHMFQKFRNLELSLYDPVRRRLPPLANKVNQAVFARWFGFWLVIKGKK